VTTWLARCQRFWDESHERLDDLLAALVNSRILALMWVVQVVPDQDHGGSQRAVRGGDQFRVVCFGHAPVLTRGFARQGLFCRARRLILFRAKIGTHFYYAISLRRGWLRAMLSHVHRGDRKNYSKYAGSPILADCPTLVKSMSDSVGILKFIWGHPANEGARARALVRAVRFQASGRLLGRRTLARLGERSIVWADLHRTGASKVVYANPPDHPEMLVWQQVLRPGDLFIDVGANIGSYTIWAADLGAEVIALEPSEDTFGLLRENVALNGYPVRTIQAAAGSVCGTARFTSGQDTVNRMDPHGSVETTMVTIDSVIEDRAVAGMKVDVEGSEIEVLRGCERALSEHRIELIQLEWNTASLAAVGTDRLPVAEQLARHGYSLYRPDPHGVLAPIRDMGFGADVFARPEGERAHRQFVPRV
jgi:FkbM family methyltransferase